MSKPKHQIAEGLLPLAVPIGKVRALPGNPRTGDVAAVARSYARFGQRKPIVARTNGQIVSGNHQWQAAKTLGWSHLAVVYVDDDDATAAAFAVADNRLSELGSIDQDAVAALLAEAAGDRSLLEATGYDSTDLERLLAATAVDLFAHADLPNGTLPSEQTGARTADTIRVAIGTLKIAASAEEVATVMASHAAWTAQHGTDAGWLRSLVTA